ncbi:MAG: DUF3467 domain-containing protein [Magnetococcales bacterium]|nr:DUF3467 domain-containing protein [Magnetococcales bacterium]
MANENEPIITRREPTDEDPKVVWDDSQMQTTFANVCNVLGTREEIMILFGSNQAWQVGQKEVKVNLSNRMVMNPYAAKRLQMMLDMALRQYEDRFGALKL